jgi:hypothetical protein
MVSAIYHGQGARMEELRRKVTALSHAETPVHTGLGSHPSKPLARPACLGRALLTLQSSVTIDAILV